ncbi:MAG: alginate export family protein [Thermodesulfovibrionales bacterium]|nr:alginate export family protein [Thermodesulfovibrionales bacterium]
MKKTVSIFMALVFVFACAISAYAAPAEIPADTKAVVAKGTTQVTIGGSVRVRGEVRHATDTFNKDTEPNRNYWDQQVRLSVQADVTPNTTARIVLENGDANKSDYTWGTETVEAFGTIPVGNGKQGTLYVLEAWLQHQGSGLFGVPAGFKIGHQPTKLGYGMFLDHSKFGNDAALFFINPIKELTLAAVYAKVTENDVKKEDDHNLYAFVAAYSPDKNTNISFDATYVDAQNYTTAIPYPVHLWNFGLRGDTKIAGFGIKADVEIQTGKIKTADIKFAGWAAKVGVDYKIDPVKLSLVYGFGSGDGDATDDKIKTYQTFQSGIWKEDFTYVYDYRTKTSAGVYNSYISNLHYLKLGANADIVKDLNVDLGVFWLRAHKDVAIFKGNPSKNLGWEIDGKITYKIDRNLQYWVEGGYLFADSAFDPTTTKKADNAYAFRQGISVSF